MTYEEIEERIRETESFAIYSLTENEINGINRISEGIRLALMEDDDTIKNTKLIKEFEKCSSRFNTGDYGTFLSQENTLTHNVFIHKKAVTHHCVTAYVLITSFIDSLRERFVYSPGTL